MWPGGDKRLQLDKQAYRDMREVTADGLSELKRNYDKVAELTGKFSSASLGRSQTERESSRGVESAVKGRWVVI